MVRHYLAEKASPLGCITVFGLLHLRARLKMLLPHDFVTPNRNYCGLLWHTNLIYYCFLLRGRGIIIPHQFITAIQYKMLLPPLCETVIYQVCVPQ